MALEFLGIDPGTNGDGCNGDNCPTAWVDGATGDYVLKGWRITDPVTLAEVGDLPDRETVIRFPRRMAQFLLEMEQ
jgi:hypothetical protein